MIVGFTGTRYGTTKPQFNALLDLLRKIKEHADVTHGLHGCCVGADAEFVMALMWLGFRDTDIEAFPSNIPKMTDLDAKRNSHITHPDNDPLERNKSIVTKADIIIACPKESVESIRSGTWSTVREARRHGKMLRIIHPDGTVVKEG